MCSYSMCIYPLYTSVFIFLFSVILIIFKYNNVPLSSTLQAKHFPWFSFNFSEVASRLSDFILFQKHQGRRKLFYGGGGGLIKNVGHHGWPMAKINKNTLPWKQSLKQSPEKRDLDQNINDSKFHICNSFFRIYYFHTFQWTSSVFLFQNL